MKNLQSNIETFRSIADRLDINCEVCQNEKELVERLSEYVLPITAITEKEISLVCETAKRLDLEIELDTNTKRF